MDGRNLLTYGSLLCAVGAIAFAVNGHSGAAGAWLAAAVIFDTFDGRFARLFARSEMQRAVGMQLDSLSDAIAFGIAPAVCVAALFPGIGPAWWMAAFAYAACAITRLAFYNLTHEQQEGFVGLPVPVAALIWASALLSQPTPLVLTGVAALTAAAMVLPLRIPRPRGVGFAAFVCWPVLVIAAHLAR
jgi:phosphatidylserine synthase